MNVDKKYIGTVTVGKKYIGTVTVSEKSIGDVSVGAGVAKIGIMTEIDEFILAENSIYIIDE